MKTLRHYWYRTKTWFARRISNIASRKELSSIDLEFCYSVKGIKIITQNHYGYLFLGCGSKGDKLNEFSDNELRKTWHVFRKKLDTMSKKNTAPDCIKLMEEFESELKLRGISVPVPFDFDPRGSFEKIIARIQIRIQPLVSKEEKYV